MGILLTSLLCTLYRVQCTVITHLVGKWNCMQRRMDIPFSQMEGWQERKHFAITNGRPTLQEEMTITAQWTRHGQGAGGFRRPSVAGRQDQLTHTCSCLGELTPPGFSAVAALIPWITAYRVQRHRMPCSLGPVRAAPTNDPSRHRSHTRHRTGLTQNIIAASPFPFNTRVGRHVALAGRTNHVDGALPTPPKTSSQTPSSAKRACFCISTLPKRVSLPPCAAPTAPGVLLTMRPTARPAPVGSSMVIL